MTGLRPSTTGIYDNSRWWRPNLPDAGTIPEAFMIAGYRVEGAGKIHHHTPGFNPPDCWHTVREPIEDCRSWVFRTSGPNQHPEDLSLKYPKDSILWPDGFPRDGIGSVKDGSCTHPYSFDWGSALYDLTCHGTHRRSIRRCIPSTTSSRRLSTNASSQESVRLHNESS